MSPPQMEKMPAEVLDYTVDWSAWLTEVSDTISSSSWTGSGVTIGATAISGSRTSAYVSGGTAGEQHTITNTIITGDGRTASRSILIKCVSTR
jgi:hypothetical protein